MGKPVRKSCCGRMGHLQRHRPCRAHVAKNDDRSGGLPFAVVDGGNGVFDRNFKSVTPDEDAVRRQVHGPVLPDCHLHRIRNGFAARGVQDSENFGHGPARRFLPRPARHFFRDEIEKSDISRDVRANHGVANAVERDLGAFLFHEQRLFHGLALDGIAQGPQQPVRLDLAFDEIVLRAFLHGLCGQRLVVQACEHDQGRRGARLRGPAVRLPVLVHRANPGRAR